MIKNEKGYALTEVLILSAVVIGVLTFMFIQFKTINRSYQKSFKYDTPEGLYLANNILNYINSDNYDSLIERLLITPEGYIDITNCDFELFKKPIYCEQLIEKSEISQILFTEENLIKLKANMRDLNADFQEYIKKIKTTNEKNDYRIVIKYNNGSFATMRFNKGNSYVQDGLIAYLDGINNTGNGHSTDTTTWKDLSGNNNDATLYNSPMWDNNSLIFDGIDDYGILTNTANQEFPDGLTVETRVKVLSADNGSNLSFIIFLDNNNSYSTRDGMSQGIYKSNTKFFNRIAVNNDFASPTQEESSNIEEYYTITTVYDNQTDKIYINGTLSNKSTKTGSYSKSSKPFNIGRQIQEGGYCANVEFQNILIYDRPLTDNEVLRNYQADMARY